MNVQLFSEKNRTSLLGDRKVVSEIAEGRTRIEAILNVMKRKQAKSKMLQRI
jgi:hypothetical protein